MRLAFLLSGENIRLAEHEVLSMLAAEEKTLDSPLLIAGMKEEREKASSKIKMLGKRLAFTHEIHQLLFSCRQSELLKEMESFHWEKIYKRNFCIRVRNLSGKELGSEFTEQKLAGFVWRSLRNPKVNLGKPFTKICIFVTGKKAYCTLLIKALEHDFESRKAHLRPEMKPTSLHPKLARALVNLTGVREGETILDPFCGLGGILLEAGLMGIKSVGYDINEEMLEKCRINLKHYRLKEFKLEKKDALKIIKKFDYVVTDLPYGRNTSVKDIEPLYLEFAKVLKKFLGKKAVVVFPDDIDYRNTLKKAKLKITGEFEQYIHRSLTKKIVVVVP